MYNLTRHILLTHQEVQSNHTRQDQAETLIMQLPKHHSGRNTWLMNYGRKSEAQTLRLNKKLSFNPATTACGDPYQEAPTLEDGVGQRDIDELHEYGIVKPKPTAQEIIYSLASLAESSDIDIEVTYDEGHDGPAHFNTDISEHVARWLRNQGYLFIALKEGSRWIHHNGNEYTVTLLANMDSDKPEYPPTVIYQGDNGKVWSRPLTEWHRSMKPKQG